MSHELLISYVSHQNYLPEVLRFGRPGVRNILRLRDRDVISRFKPGEIPCRKKFFSQQPSYYSQMYRGQAVKLYGSS
jgi:hypothetical protein